MLPAALAVVQTDCRLADPVANTAMVVRKLHVAADTGAELVVFPECVLSGYGFASRAAAVAVAETVPGPGTEAVAVACAARGVWCVFGLLERAGDQLFNTAVVVGPRGLVGKYHKTHLPLVGADKFTDPGHGPLAVFDLDGLKVGVGVCFDGGFPEFPRALALLGADLIVLPTNWADKAMTTARFVPPVRALENGVYFAACNRVGTESGYHYIGRSSIHDPSGSPLATADHDGEDVLFARIDPELARRKKVVNTPGEYEVDRVNWRRPELYGLLAEPMDAPFRGHHTPGTGNAVTG
jgi:predicted amidohydrolase